MAELFLAKDTRSDRVVVLKRILPYLAEEDEFVHMFLDEARIAASLHHPNVVEVLELGNLLGNIFIAMEWVNGNDLRRVLQIEKDRGGVVPPGIAAWVVARMCEGLHYAHQRAAPDGSPLGIIHRDISPQNVMVSFRADVKLVDFGIAKAGAWVSRSQPGIIKGKFLYLAPEQLSQEKADLRADLFSVGTLLYELTTGKSPFFRPTGEEVIYAIKMEEAEAPLNLRPGFPASLSRVIMKCLQKDRTRRYQTADEVRAALDDFMRVDAPTTRPDVARYLSTLFGDEAERTKVHIPPNAVFPPRLGDRDAAPTKSVTEPMKTAPIGSSGLEGALHVDDEKTVDMTAPVDDRPTVSLSAPLDADLPPTSVSVSAPRELRGGDLHLPLLPERFQLDDVQTRTEDDRRPGPPVPSSESLPEVSGVVSAPEATLGFDLPPTPPPLPRKPAPQPKPPRRPPPPGPPIKTPAPRRRLTQALGPADRAQAEPPYDPDDYIATVDYPVEQVEQPRPRKPRARAKKPVDRRGQYVLVGIIVVSLVSVVILLTLALRAGPREEAPPPTPTPSERAETPLRRSAPAQVRVTLRTARASHVTVDGAALTGATFQHAPGAAQVAWQCPAPRKHAPPVDHSLSLTLQEGGPVVVDLACP